jgi:hypothetical protein
MKVKDILPYIDDIVAIYINDELQVSFVVVMGDMKAICIGIRL